jgi:glycosyltransferase involved in cell wall biosynthesis
VTPKLKPAPATIAFDTWVLGPRALNHGVHVYAKKLLQNFRRLAPDYSLEIAPYVSKSNNGVGALPQSPGFRPRPTGLLGHSRLWRFGGASALASFGHADLIFNPHCLTLYAGSLVPTVTTIHDVIPVVLPWKARAARILRLLLWSAARSSRAIITVSQHSKADLIRVYGLADSQVHVVYNGCDHEVFNAAPPDPDLVQRLKTRMGIERPYILHYGAIKPNKNLKRLILAYGSLLHRNSKLELDLVLAGKADSAYDEVSQVAELTESARGKVVLTGALEQSELVAMVKGASLAVFPSLYEGFCLPMVESMACGVPTIAANSSCLPEISGGTLRYFDPESVQGMATCMEAILNNEHLGRELSNKGRARAAQFDWARCAGETLAILARVAREEAA